MAHNVNRSGTPCYLQHFIEQQRYSRQINPAQALIVLLFVEGLKLDKYHVYNPMIVSRTSNQLFTLERTMSDLLNNTCMQV